MGRVALRPYLADGRAPVSEPVPAWLAAWHEERGTQPVTQRAAPATPAPPTAPAVVHALTAPASQRPAPPRVHPLSKGFTEPRPWDFDGCARREPVLDHDYHPPRVVRRVGWQRCMSCRRPFWSDDAVRLRLCTANSGGCRDHDDRFAQGEPGGSYGRCHD